MFLFPIKDFLLNHIMKFKIHLFLHQNGIAQKGSKALGFLREILFKTWKASLFWEKFFFHFNSYFFYLVIVQISGLPSSLSSQSPLCSTVMQLPTPAFCSLHESWHCWYKQLYSPIFFLPRYVYKFHWESNLSQHNQQLQKHGNNCWCPLRKDWGIICGTFILWNTTPQVLKKNVTLWRATKWSQLETSMLSDMNQSPNDK